jgi:hypothetical protein
VVVLSQVVCAEPALITIKDSFLNKEYALRLPLPDGFRLEKTTPDGTDFRVYEVSKDSKIYLTLYVGNHPDFPVTHVEGSEKTDLDICVEDPVVSREASTRDSEDKPEVRIVSEWKDGRLVHRELLAPVNKLQKGWPAFIHAFTASSLQEDEIQVADRILFGISLKQVVTAASSPNGD